MIDPRNTSISSDWWDFFYTSTTSSILGTFSMSVSVEDDTSSPPRTPAEFLAQKKASLAKRHREKNKARIKPWEQEKQFR